MNNRDRIKEEALKITTNIIDPEWHGKGYPTDAELIVDSILSIKGLHVEADDQTFPDVTTLSSDMLTPYESRRAVQFDMIDEGWIKVDKGEK